MNSATFSTLADALRGPITLIHSLSDRISDVFAARRSTTTSEDAIGALRWSDQTEREMADRSIHHPHCSLYR